MKKNLTGKIKSIKKIALDTYEIKIVSGLAYAWAGQFISILTPKKTLRRPFSIADFEDDTITILFKKIGEGTSYISSLKEGDEIDFLAPLGHGFQTDKKKSLLIGAGIGIAPMLFLKKELDKENIENYLISGFKADNEVIEGSDETIIGGSVLDNIQDLINEYKPEIIYSCGPKAVLKKVSRIARDNNIKSQLALEKVMACSIGVCRGCVIKLNKGNTIVNASVCQDGPVFWGDEILWS